MTAAYFNLRSV